MHGFDDVTLGWKGDEFVVPANRMLMLGALIEFKLTTTINESGQEVPTGEQAMTVLMQRQGPPHLRMARAYGAALRFAGASVTDDEVHLSLQDDLSKGDAAGVASLQLAVVNLIAIFNPALGSVLLSVSEKKSQTVKPKMKPEAA